MNLRRNITPTRMQRVALVCPKARLRAMLVQVADAGVVELSGSEGQDRSPEEPGGLQLALGTDGPGGQLSMPRLCETEPDMEALRRAGRDDLAAGEAELVSYAAAAVTRGDVAAVAGWIPSSQTAALAARLAGAGASVVPLPLPRGVDPPTLLARGTSVHRSFTSLVDTYGTVPYSNIDPSMLAGFAYVVMFGMMFGDAGHGVLLLVVGILLWAGVPARLSRFRRVWPFVVGAGFAAVGFGLLYGEFFGPTGVIPVLWISPLDEPITLLAAALGVGAVLLAGAQIVGTVNRWREGGWPTALSAPSGIAGIALLAGLGLALLGVGSDIGWAVVLGAVLAACGVAFAFLGFLANAGEGIAALAQAIVEVFDAVTRAATNLISFTRLAAFGLTHAALSAIVWDGTTGLWRAGGVWVAASIVVFTVGTVLAFGLEALVAGVQALRLEYYELFSRVFTGVGHPFRPWHIAIDEHPPHTSVQPSAESAP